MLSSRAGAVQNRRIAVLLLLAFATLGATTATAKALAAKDYTSIRQEYPCGADGGYKYYVTNSHSERAVRVTIRVTQVTNECLPRSIIESKTLDLEPGGEAYLGCDKMVGMGSSGPTFSYSVAGARFLSSEE